MNVAGLFGKLPARGDFVRLGLPGSFVAPWDSWLQLVLAGSRERLGAAWLPAWLEAPVWRFALAPGLCGADGMLGLLLPSVDRVGRYFPLTIAVAPAPGGLEAEAWLDAAEAAGRTALEQDAAPEQVAARLLPPPDGAVPAAGSLWWSAGGPRVAATRHRFAALPDAAAFTAMLSDSPRSTEMSSDLSGDPIPAEPAP
jgi:type VI secretion system protein ImpM